MSISLDTLLRQADIGRSRSSVLNPLQWIMVIFIAGEGALSFAHAERWLIVTIGCLIVADFLLFAGAFIYFMLRDPAALRSEPYALSWHAMQKGFFSDRMFATVSASTAELETRGGVEIQNPADLLQKDSKNADVTASAEEKP